MAPIATSFELFINLPSEFRNPATHTIYIKGRFLGNGSFARCYEVFQSTSKKYFACKVVPKAILNDENLRSKFKSELCIQKEVSHQHVVRFQDHFEDNYFAYIVLELCRHRSLLQLQKRRRILTDYECRYYMHQIIEGLSYLHSLNIVHRDLKLANLFLDDDMQVKIGDFGLATYVTDTDDGAKSVCGTPNYMAPEVVQKQGYSYGVDVWALGCIMYTLLVGRPPFETTSLKTTYVKIRNGDFEMPKELNSLAADMINSLLQTDPDKRPKAHEIGSFEFMVCEEMPKALPVAWLAMEPRLDRTHKDLCEWVSKKKFRETLLFQHDLDVNYAVLCPLTYFTYQQDYHADMVALEESLRDIINSQPPILKKNLSDEFTSPQDTPLYWISKWLDCTAQYGFGYQLSDGSLGIMLNDGSRIINLAGSLEVQYIDCQNKEYYMHMNVYPEVLAKKVQLLYNFKRYMDERLVCAGANRVAPKMNVLSRVPQIWARFHSGAGIGMALTNGTFQFNFLDHSKFVLCPRMQAVTYIYKDQDFCTYSFSTITMNGCSKDMMDRLRYIQAMLQKLMT